MYYVEAFGMTHSFDTWEKREQFLEETIRPFGYLYGSDYTTHEKE